MKRVVTAIVGVVYLLPAVACCGWTPGAKQAAAPPAPGEAAAQAAAGRIEFDKTVTLAAGAVQEYTFEAAPRQQRVYVQVSNPEAVDVHVTQGSAAPDVRQKLEKGQVPMGASGMRKVTQQSFFTRTAGGVYGPIVVLLSGAKKQTEVKLTVNDVGTAPGGSKVGGVGVMLVGEGSGGSGSC